MIKIKMNLCRNLNTETFLGNTRTSKKKNVTIKTLHFNWKSLIWERLNFLSPKNFQKCVKSQKMIFHKYLILSYIYKKTLTLKFLEH